MTINSAPYLIKQEETIHTEMAVLPYYLNRETKLKYRTSEHVWLVGRGGGWKCWLLHGGHLDSFYSCGVSCLGQSPSLAEMRGPIPTQEWHIPIYIGDDKKHKATHTNTTEYKNYESYQYKQSLHDDYRLLISDDRRGYLQIVLNPVCDTMTVCKCFFEISIEKLF